MLEIRSSGELVLSKWFVPVCNMSSWGAVWISLCKYDLACSISGVLIYLTSWFENIFSMSKNFPFKSHRKITSLELLVLLVAGDLGGCWELVSSGLFCVSFLGGFSGRS